KQISHFHLATAIYFIKIVQNSPLFFRNFHSHLTIDKRSEPQELIELRLLETQLASLKAVGYFRLITWPLSKSEF
ncbi:MAG: hypothetical protein ACI86C_001292, partial [Candidatus Latescibacterota bacterium]